MQSASFDWQQIFPQARYSTSNFESSLSLSLVPSTPIWIIKLSIENGNFRKHAPNEDDVKMQTLPYGFNEKF